MPPASYFFEAGGVAAKPVGSVVKIGKPIQDSAVLEFPTGSFSSPERRV
jgi:hypothetical protein